MSFRYAGISLCAALMLISCADDTGSIGVPSDADIITSSVETFDFTTRSIELGAVAANSTSSYFGRVHDEATDIDVCAEFLAQFHTFEDYTLPEVERLVKNSDGNVQCFGIELRLYYTTYQGDASNPMKMQIFELDKNHVISEGVTYYSDIDLSSYINPLNTNPIAEKTFTAEDQTVSEDERSASGYYASIHIPLDTVYGERILQAAVEHPEYFKDSYHFIRNVCPGFYFKLKSGNGTMFKIDVGVLNVYFKYTDESGNILNGIARFSATPEVIQSTRIENSGISSLMARTNDSEGNAIEPFTYLTSPAGIATEMTLPVDDIYLGHENDSISRARIVLTCMNKEESSTIFQVPSTLLLVRKASMKSFFEERKVADGMSSFVTSFDNTSNAYTFVNISTLISQMYHEKETVMLRDGLTSEQYNKANPEWNTVVLVPVVTTQNSSNILTSVQHDFSLGSVRVVGGTQTQHMQIIYSTFSN